MSDTIPNTIDELEVKQKLAGTVKKVELGGAIVDVGVGHDGLLHISQLKEGRVKNVAEVVNEGQAVTVWVRRLDKSAGRIDLTMIEPPAVSWGELKVGQTITGTVVRLEKFGAFVDVGAERPGLIHVSELAEGYVKSPSDIVAVGDEIEAKIIGVNRKKGRIDLSVKALMPTPLEVAAEQEEDEDVPTAFALAYQRALEQEGTPGEDAAGSSEGESGQRRLQDELLARTLDQHRDRE